MNPNSNFVVHSPLGPLAVSCSPSGLTRLSFLKHSVRGLKQSKQRHQPFYDLISTQLDEYFSGERKSFSIPLDLSGTLFQQEAWMALLKIPYGTTITYQEQARWIERPTATRAIGSANGKNPVPIVIPCHRVISSSGDLGGYSGGIRIKEFLIGLEANNK